MATKIGPGPRHLDDLLLSPADHTGPASYSQVTPGATPTGGDSITAAELGLKFIEGVLCSGDDTGSYLPVPIAMLSPQTTVILRWFVAATMAEVGAAVNLSARHTRLIAWGR